MNKTVRKNINHYTRNKEGARTFKVNAAQELYSIASSFMFRNGSYFTDKERVIMLEDAIEHNCKAGDKDFALATAWFLGAVQGIRLSPTVILSNMVYDGHVNLTSDKAKVEKVIGDVFTRPDFIANSLAYYKMHTGSKSFSTAPRVFLNMLRDKLATYKPITLKKRKMKSRSVKLADLIKVLRPRPVNDEMSKLYKDIIENNNAASLKVLLNKETMEVESAESLTAVLSSTAIDSSVKTKFVADNIKTIAINELIRNMVNVPTSSYDDLKDRLNSVFNDVSALRLINPFDLVLLNSKTLSMGGNAELRQILDDVLERVILNNMSFDVKNPVFLVDISGSMDFDDPKRKSINTAIMYLSLILPIVLRKADAINFKYYDFGTRLHDITNQILTDVRTGKLVLTPNKVAEYLARHYKGRLTEGTSLRDCTDRAIRANLNCDGLFIFTDEVSWADTKTVDTYARVIPENLQKRTFLINVDSTQSTMFSPKDRVVRISGLDGKVLFLLNSLLDFATFKSNVVKLFLNSINKQ